MNTQHKPKGLLATAQWLREIDKTASASQNRGKCKRCGIEISLNQIYAGGNCWSCNQPDTFKKREADRKTFIAAVETASVAPESDAPWLKMEKVADKYLPDPVEARKRDASIKKLTAQSPAKLQAKQEGKPELPQWWGAYDSEGKLRATFDSESEAYHYTRNRGHMDGGSHREIREQENELIYKNIEATRLASVYKNNAEALAEALRKLKYADDHGLNLTDSINGALAALANWEGVK